VDLSLLIAVGACAEGCGQESSGQHYDRVEEEGQERRRWRYLEYVNDDCCERSSMFSFQCLVLVCDRVDHDWTYPTSSLLATVESDILLNGFCGG
jgi:hypothetical protein